MQHVHFAAYLQNLYNNEYHLMFVLRLYRTILIIYTRPTAPYNVCIIKMDYDDLGAHNNQNVAHSVYCVFFLGIWK